MTQRLRRELATVAGSEYWSETEGRAAVAAWRASGESAERFGAQHGLSSRRLRYWGRRLGTSTVSRNSANANIELIPIDVIQRDEPASIEVTVGEFRVRVARGVDPGALRTVIEVLRSC